MTITLQAVNELIASLESAGELSIKERKYLELAKAYQQLAAENARYSMSAGHADQRMAESRAVRSALGFNPDADDVSPSDLVEAINQTVAELCVIRTAHPQPLGSAMDAAIDAFNAEEMPETGMLNAYFILRDSIRIPTPATDRIVAGIKAEAKSHDLNAFISHYSAELDTHIANGGDQFDERAVRLRGVIVGARMFREKLREEEKATPGPWEVARDGKTLVSNQSHPIATVSDAMHRMLADGSTGKDAEFIALANPANILALVNALEKAQRHANLTEAERQAYLGLISKRDERIAELESRTVKMPEPFKLAKSSSGLTYYYADEVNEALSAAGIKWEDE